MKIINKIKRFFHRESLHTDQEVNHLRHALQRIAIANTFTNPSYVYFKPETQELVISHVFSYDGEYCPDTEMFYIGEL